MNAMISTSIVGKCSSASLRPSERVQNMQVLYIVVRK